MTPQRAKELLPIITAYAEGKEIEVGNRQGFFRPCENEEFDDDCAYYRIKPTPTYRPWKPEEVPVGGLLKNSSVDFTHHPVSLILSVRGAWIGIAHPVTFKVCELLARELLDNDEWSYSADNGKTWHPCGVLE